MTENSRRNEIANKIASLKDTLTRSTTDREEAIKREIKALEEEYLALPPDTVNAGDIYLSKKTVYEGSRYRLKEYKGKLWLYDDTQCLTDKIEFENGEPVRAKVFVKDSDNPEGKEYVFNLKVNQQPPKKAPNKSVTIKGYPHWNCPYCRTENPLEYDICYHCHASRPKEAEAINA